MFLTSDLIEQLAAEPKNQFVSFKTMRRRTEVVLKYNAPAYEAGIDANPAKIQMPDFEFYFLRSLGVAFGYLFVCEHKIVTIRPNYWTLQRPSSQGLGMLTGIKLAFNDPYINIYTSQDGCALISKAGLHSVIVPEMIRRSKSREEKANKS